MKSIFARSSLAALLSMLGSLLVVVTIVPALGGVVDGNAWLMTMICPVVIAWPASAFSFWQSDRLKRAHAELDAAHRELAESHRRLAEKTRYDEMTGALNRENFFGVLKRMHSERQSGALLIIDADHFKSVNDRFGHLTGDDALLEIVGAIRRGVRAGDVLGRIGGEEFGALLIGASETEARRIAERIRQQVEALRFRPETGPILSLTVSIGGTAVLPDTPVRELMRAADRRLYEAKRQGRNRAIYGHTLTLAA